LKKEVSDFVFPTISPDFKVITVTFFGTFPKVLNALCCRNPSCGRFAHSSEYISPTLLCHVISPCSKLAKVENSEPPPVTRSASMDGFNN